MGLLGLLTGATEIGYNIKRKLHFQLKIEDYSIIGPFFQPNGWLV